MSMLVNFHFVRPWWLLALIPIALLLVYIWRQHKNGHAWQKVIAPDFLNYLLEDKLNKQSRWPIGLLTLGWLLSVLALAGPAWTKLPQPVFKNQSAIVVAWDLSASMYATDSAPDRFTVAKHKLLDLLHARADGLTALVVYAGDAHIVTPLTDDVNTIENMVTSISPDIMPIPGSQAPEAINMAINLLKQANQSQGNIVLISDGIDDDQVQKVVQSAQKNNMAISVLAIGTVEGSAVTLPNGALLKDNNDNIVTPILTRAALQKVAKQTNGLYVEAQLDDSDINALVANSSQTNITQDKPSERYSDVWQEEGAWLVLLLLPMAAWCFRRGWLLSLFLMITLYHTQNANAGIFKTADQEGYAAFKQQDYKKAAELFKNPDWKGTSYYKAGEYDKAAEVFATTDTANANYNRGNSLVELGKNKENGAPPSYQEAANAYEEAIKAYEHTLELDAAHQKAKDNKTIAEKLLADVKKKIEEQEKQQQNQNADQSQQNDQQKSSDQQKQDAQKNNENQQQNKDGSASQDKAQQEGSKGDQQSQPQSEQQSAQSMDKSDKLPDEKNNAAEKQAAEASDKTDKPGNDAAQQNITSAEEGKKENADKQANTITADTQHSMEEKQALEQWLRKVPDDPAGLLERKFRYQSQQNESSADSDKTW